MVLESYTLYLDTDVVLVFALFPQLINAGHFATNHKAKAVSC